MADKHPAQRRKRRLWPWLLLAAVIGLVVWFTFSTAKVAQQSFSQETAALRDIVTYYSFEGNLTPITDEVQTAKEAMKVKEVYVAEGDMVAEGDPLLRSTDGARIYAAHTGTVETLFAEADDTLQPGSQLCRIVDWDHLEVSVNVDEYDISAITEGKEGTVYLNALDAAVPGTVTEIGREAVIEGGVSFYPVKFGVDALPGVRSGMSVEVQVLNRQSLGAVSLPLTAISYDEYNKPYVLVQQGEEYAAREITLGVSDGTNVEVLTGLADGESVYYLSNDLARFFAMQQKMMGGMAP